MNKEQFNHVGRPTNEEVYERKKKKIIKVILIAVLLLVVPAGVYVALNIDNFNLSRIMGNSATPKGVVGIKNDNRITRADYARHLANVRLYRSGAVMQSFAISGGYVYYSQQQSTTSGGYITRVSTNAITGAVSNTGQYLGDEYFILKDAGHVANIDIEETGGKKYLWIGCMTKNQKKNGKGLCRIPLEDIKFNKTIQTPGNTKNGYKEFLGKSSITAVHSNSNTLVSLTGSKKTYNFEVYNLNEFIKNNGNIKPRKSFTIKHSNNNYSRQGIDVYNGYIYSLEGNISSSKNKKVFISVYDINTGKAVIYRKRLNYPTGNY